MIVVDGSALALAVADTTNRGSRVLSALRDGAVAPHLVDAEVGQALRGLVLRGALDAPTGQRSLRAAEALVVERFAHSPLSTRAWELRASVSYYDGLYVALAELLGLALVTADRRLGRARGPRCQMEVV